MSAASTPETDAKMKHALKLMPEHWFKEASADHWEKIHIAGRGRVEGYDFYSEGRALGCEPDEKEDSFRSVCRSLPPVPLREGDIVQLWAGITVRVEKTEKLVLGDTPYLVVQGQTHQSRRDQLLTAPWLGG